MNNEFLELIPVEKYVAPKIPTLADDNSAALKKLPARWKKNAKVVACIAAMGTLSLGAFGAPLHVSGSQSAAQAAASASQSLASSSQAKTSEESANHNEITVLLNGKKLDFDAPPMIVNNFTMVPFRAIFSALGMDVEWDEERRTVIGRGLVFIEIPIGSSAALVNGNDVQLPTPAMIHEGRTFVPLRFVAEATGADVNWVADTRTVEITTTDSAISGYALGIRSHGGGSGGIPFYVVYLTEQEISNILTEQFAAAEIIFDSPPSEKVAVVTQEYFDYLMNEMYEFDTPVEIGLFNAEKNIGIAKVGEASSGFVKLAEDAFAEQHSDLTVGVIRNPRVDFDSSQWVVPSLDEISEAGARAREDLIAQIQKFIAFLREEKII